MPALAHHRLITRALAALLLGASTVLATLPAPTPALALEPPQPLPGYTPAFVTEREPGVWDDCTWAAAEMFLDKWTSGQTIVDRRQLRKLSGDKEGGSNLADVERAFARLGLDLETSPKGGASVTWAKLLDRLSNGGGAILLGDYGNLPRVNGRWDPGFWRGERETDDHALYLDRYDATTGKIFVMDPLAPADWTGEWIRASALKKFAWRTGSGKLWAALTPAALAGPFEGVELGEPVAIADGSMLRVSWPISDAPQGWTFPGADVSAEITPISEADPIDPLDPTVAALAAPGSEPVASSTQIADPIPSVIAVAPAALASSFELPLPIAVDPSSPGTASSSVGAAPPGDGSPAVDHGSIQASVPLPAAPGIYRATVTAIDLRTGARVATAGPMNLYVPGPRAASFVGPENLSAEPGALVAIAFAVRNTGITSWAESPLVSSLPPDVRQPRNSRLVGTWVAPLQAGFDGQTIPAIPDPIDFGPIALEPGYGRLVEVLVRVPVDPGSWRLVLDVVDDEDGSFALSGSAPDIIFIEVHRPGGGSGLQ